MAKRKRETDTDTTTTPSSSGTKKKKKKKKKRASGKGQVSSPHPHGSFDSEQEYKIKEILQEKGKYYLIAWEDDETTGEKCDPTWEPKENANQLAIEDWEQKKKAAPKKPKGRSKGKRKSSTTATASTPTSAAAPVRTRPIRVIPSSSAPNSSATKGENEEAEVEPEIGETQPASTGAETADSSLFVSDRSEQSSRPPSRRSQQSSRPPSRLRQVTVQPCDPPSSYQRGAYERFDDQVSPLDSSVPSPVDAGSGREIPESDAESQGQTQGESQSQTQENTDLTTGRTVPESQTLPEHEESTWRGFSPTQQQLPLSPEREKQLTLQGFPELAPKENGRRASLDTQTSIEAQVGAELEAAVEEGGDVQQEDGEVAKSNGDRQTSVNWNHFEEEEQADPGAEEESDPSEPKDNLDTEQTDTAAQQTKGLAQTETGGDPPIAAAQDSSEEDEDEDEIRVDLPSNRTSPFQRLGQQRQQHRHPRESQVEQTAAPEIISKSSRESSAAAPETVQVILVESSADQDSSGQFLLQPNFEPPTPDQRPPPSSAPNGNHTGPDTPEDPVPPAEQESQDHLETTSQNPLSNLSKTQSRSLPTTQSSTRFQTQLPPKSRPSIEEIEEDEHREGPAQAAERAHTMPETRDQMVSYTRGMSPRQGQSPESSPFPSVPSQSMGTIGESAPAKIPTPSLNSSSAADPKPNHVPRSKGRVDEVTAASKTNRNHHASNLRQRTPALAAQQPASSLPPNMSAEVAAARQSSPFTDGGRSPSAVPALEVEPEITKDEMNTSERLDTLLPQAQGRSLDTLEGHGRLGKAARPHPEEPNADPEAAFAHTVPIVLAGHQRDQYFQNIYYWRDTIGGFLDERYPTEQQIASAEMVVERLRSISMHPDLVNQDTLSQVSTPERQAQWDVDASAKFHFLNELFTQLDGLAMHVALVAGGDRVPDMLETFLQGTHIPYNRNPSARAEFHSTNLGLRVSIIDLDQDVSSVDGAHLVVAMDGSVDYRHPVIQAARQHRRDGPDMTDTNAWAMLLTLVVPSTVEHIERCLIPGMSRKARANAILSATRRLKNDAGKAEAGQFMTADAAVAVGAFLKDQDSTDWPLVGLTLIEDLDSQTDTDLDHSNEGASFRRTRSRSPEKRPFADVSMGSPTDPKRQRLDVPEMSGTINPQDIEVTHVSESMGKATQDAASHPSQEQLEQAQNTLLQYERDLHKVQFQNEEQRTELVAIKKSRDDELRRAQTALERLSVTESNNRVLREERTSLKEQLEEANRRLLDHSVPEKQEFEAMRLEASAAQLAKEKAEKKVAGLEKEMDYTRDLYQEASSRARDLAAHNAELESRLEVAEKQARGEQARALQLSHDLRTKALERDNARMKQMLKDREAGMRMRDEEIQRLKEAGRGRIGTRNSSVPKSPRLGSPVPRGRGSRQASPSAGDLRPRGGGHPLRNERREL